MGGGGQLSETESDRTMKTRRGVARAWGGEERGGAVDNPAGR
jgi:hypothetical protein